MKTASKKGKTYFIFKEFILKSLFTGIITRTIK